MSVCLYAAIPAGTQRNNNFFITSKRCRWRRFDVMKTLSLRHYYVMCPLGMCLYSFTYEYDGERLESNTKHCRTPNNNEGT